DGFPHRVHRSARRPPQERDHPRPTAGPAAASAPAALPVRRTAERSHTYVVPDGAPPAGFAAVTRRGGAHPAHDTGATTAVDRDHASGELLVNGVQWDARRPPPSSEGDRLTPAPADQTVGLRRPPSVPTLKSAGAPYRPDRRGSSPLPRRLGL